jgi:Fic family protein
MSKHALKTHDRTDKWSAKDFEEYLKRIKTGRTITEVGRDEDMPCREVFDEYRRDNPDFAEKFEKIWDKLPFHVQVRGQRTGERFKKQVVKLRLKELRWPEIAQAMGVKESTVRNCWHRLKWDGLLANYN